jgi:epoxyqueuosine reductase
MEKGNEGLAEWIADIAKKFIDESPENTLKNEANEKAWDEPLVGFSKGSDPLYQFYNERIGERYLSPVEIFNHAFPGAEAEPEQLMVISWILPQTKATKTEHGKGQVVTERWARSTIYGEEVSLKLGRHLISTLGEAGYKAVAPATPPLWNYIQPSQASRIPTASNWSERHAAYAAGLGTFGLCDGLITPAGKAMRCGSVIAPIHIHPSPRPYADHHAYCLFYAEGTCGKCIERCPAGAISKEGHDKAKCGQYLYQVERQYIKDHYDLEGYACGLCQTCVPCESGIPVKRWRNL